MKILFAVKAYYPEIGGTELAAKRIVDILSKENNVTVLTTILGKKRKVKEKVIELEAKSSYFYMSKLNETLEKEKFDLYISFGFGKHYFDRIASFCEKKNLPCIAVLAGGFHTKEKGITKKIYELLIAKKTLRMYTKIIVATKQEKKYWTENFSVPENKIIVIPHTLPKGYIKFKKTKILEKYDLVKGKYIFYIGRMAKNKLPELLIKAYKKAKVKNKLVIAGKGTKTKELTQLSEKANIVFLGEVTENEKKELMKNCAFFVFPSNYESFGLVILEAVAFKKPIIVSNLPVFHELIKEEKYFFENDINSITKKINEFCDKKYGPPKIKLPKQEKMLLREITSIKI